MYWPMNSLIICQKRLSANAAPALPSACSGALELEATIATDVIARGRPYSPVLSDRSEQPRWWGVAGHYYTVYLTSVAAGLDPAISFRNALFAQMPDPVDELDATAAGPRPLVAALGAAGNSMATGLGPGAGLGSQPFSPQLPSSDDIVVQRGLHALTGNNAKDEQTVRCARFKGLPMGDVAFGLALHAFGDSDELSQDQRGPQPDHQISRGTGSV